MQELLSWQDMLWHLANLVILYIVFRRYLYKPLVRFLNKRTQSFEEERLRIDEEREQAQAVRREGALMMEKARNQADKAAADVLKQADRDAKNILDQATRQAEIIIEQARETANEEQRKARETMRDEIADLSVNIATTILRHEVSEESHKQFVDDFLTKVG